MRNFLTNLVLGLASRQLSRALAGRMSPDRFTRRRLLRRVRTLRARANLLERDLEQERAADTLLTRPVDLPEDASLFYRPLVFQMQMDPMGHCEPSNGLRLSPDLELFHDCEDPQFNLRQVTANTGLPYALLMDGFAPSGTFLSLVVSLPPEEAARTAREDLIRLTFDIEIERNIELFARLNLRHGPNVEQIVREVDFNSEHHHVEFDVFFTQFDPKRGEGLWIDLIFQPPNQNAVLIRDITITRRPRATL